jgi:uncharacterized protein (DUF433 family)
MSIAATYPHLTIDASGVARIGTTRYKVIQLAAEHYHYGWTAEEILRQHPDLKPEEVYASLTYFYDHHDELVAQMNAQVGSVEADANIQRFSREELLRRRAAKDH